MFYNFHFLFQLLHGRQAVLGLKWAYVLESLTRFGVSGQLPFSFDLLFFKLIATELGIPLGAFLIRFKLILTLVNALRFLEIMIKFF